MRSERKRANGAGVYLGFNEADTHLDYVGLPRCLGLPRSLLDEPAHEFFRAVA